MKYSDARPLIKTGDMLLWRDSGTGGWRSLRERWIVRHGTASPYSHVGVALVEHGRVMVMDMTRKGCAPHPLSACVPFDWAPAPRELTPRAVDHAYSLFGELIYSTWQAIMGALKRVTIGVDVPRQCASVALSIWSVDGMVPTDTATPGACADGALLAWDSAVRTVNSGVRLI